MYVFSTCWSATWQQGRGDVKKQIQTRLKRVPRFDTDLLMPLRATAGKILLGDRGREVDVVDVGQRA